jgi:uncharacterized membrane protein YidH (DUF202 family)
MPEPAWRHEGTEPDYRFTLANERTFLAWIRTALAWTRTALAIAVNALLSGALLGVAAATLVASAGGVASVFVGGVA